jgi:hypothetical protein
MVTKIGTVAAGAHAVQKRHRVAAIGDIITTMAKVAFYARLANGALIAAIHARLDIFVPAVHMIHHM